MNQAEVMVWVTVHQMPWLDVPREKKSKSGLYDAEVRAAGYRSGSSLEPSLTPLKSVLSSRKEEMAWAVL